MRACPQMPLRDIAAPTNGSLGRPGSPELREQSQNVIENKQVISVGGLNTYNCQLTSYNYSGPTTGLVSVPMLSTVMLTVSPGWRCTGGLR